MVIVLDEITKPSVIWWIVTVFVCITRSSSRLEKHGGVLMSPSLTRSCVLKVLRSFVQLLTSIRELRIVQFNSL